MRLAGRIIALLIMLAPAALTAYVGSGDTTWLVAAGVLLVLGLGADAAVAATWRGERAYAQPAEPVRATEAAEAQRIEALRNLTADLAILAGDANAPARAATGGNSRFDVVLTRPGRNRIAVIKEVRALRSCDLREAKDLVERAQKRPAVLAAGVPEAEARRLHRALTAMGASAELRAARAVTE